MWTNFANGLKKGLDLPYSHENRLGVNLHRQYLDQYPEFRLKYQRALDDARAEKSNELFIVQNWLNYLKGVFGNLDIRAEDFSNMDETGLMLEMTQVEEFIVPGCKYRHFFRRHGGTRE
ncbi:hypothetical protein GcM3_189019 [Golovinomyces cichoracearum]|uniref:Uncharacterized protein n=1 Tax=Golovinomyces cichoracearum TaxID=62708 RepID=A0A420HIS1_9PEZI|nr:hypothetical protein GcM3_189019 [Golovinomyces cichoracearum]